MVALFDSENQNRKTELNRWDEFIRTGKVCPYCGDLTMLVDSSVVYGGTVSYGNIYSCKPCKAYVGVHKGTNTAKGSLANKRLRKLRKKAHECFDPLWEAKMQRDRCSQSDARNAGYGWLSKELGIPFELMHIAYLGEEDCQRVIDLCSRFLKR